LTASKGKRVKKALISAATVCAVATGAHAGELADIQTEAKLLREQNQMLTKRLADLERRQRKLEAQEARQSTAPPAAQSAIATRPTGPLNSIAADFSALKNEYKKAAASDDSLTWHGITLYGMVDLGVAYQNHGTPLSGTSVLGLNYLVSKNSNGSYFGVAPNALSSSFVGLRGNQEIADGLSAVFNLQTGFNPESGTLSNGLGSIVQNNGLSVGAQNAFGDSSRNGQLFNMAAYAGLSSPIYGTLTYGRQTSLSSDGVVNYDPMGNSGAFSVIGFQGTTGGAGSTENRILDNSFKYAVNLGPFRAAVDAALSNGGNNAPGNVIEGQIGGDYQGLSLDAIYSHVQNSISAAPLTPAQVLAVNSLGFGEGAGSISATVSDNTAIMLLAKYSAGPLGLFGGYEHIQFANPSSPLTPGAALEGGYTIGVVNNTAFATDKVLQIFWGGVRYTVRSDIDLLAAYYHEDQNSFEGGTPATLNAAHCRDASLAQCSGQLDAISFLADYRFAKRFDAYAGIMWSQVSNGLANGFLQRSSIDPTIGLRFHF
jgi:predicted porin